MARGCGAKHICASKCRKHLSVGDILEVPMFQNATPLWREAYLQVKMRKHHIPGAILEVPMFQNATRLWRKAHFKVKMCKTPHSRSHFGSCDVQKWHAAVARSIFVSQNVGKTDGYGHHFLEV